MTIEDKLSLLEWIKAVDGILAAVFASILGFFISRYLSKKQAKTQMAWEDTQSDAQRLWEEKTELKRKEWEQEILNIDRWIGDKKKLYVDFIVLSERYLDILITEDNINTVLDYFKGNLKNIPEDGSAEDFLSRLEIFNVLPKNLMDIYRADKELFKREFEQTSDQLSIEKNDVFNLYQQSYIEITILSPLDLVMYASDLYMAVRQNSKEKFRQARYEFIEKVREDLHIPISLKHTQDINFDKQYSYGISLLSHLKKRLANI